LDVRAAPLPGMNRAVAMYSRGWNNVTVPTSAARASETKAIMVLRWTATFKYHHHDGVPKGVFSSSMPYPVASEGVAPAGAGRPRRSRKFDKEADAVATLVAPGSNSSQG
jgi:hypothetical protein